MYGVSLNEISSRPAKFGRELARHVFGVGQNCVLTQHSLLLRASVANAGRKPLSQALRDFFQEGIKARFEKKEEQEAALRAADLYGYELRRRLQQRS